MNSERYPPITDKALRQRLEHERLQVWIVGPGGSGINMLANHLETHGIRSITKSWKQYGCHRIRPVSVRGCKAIFVTADPRVALRSQMVQGLYGLNVRKLSNFESYECKDSDLFYTQAKEWINYAGPMPIFYVRYESIPYIWNILSMSIMGDSTISAPKWIDRKTVLQDDSLGRELDGRTQLWRRYLENQNWYHKL